MLTNKELFKKTR
jgi:magnesium-transporting ATPase (P-type)